MKENVKLRILKKRVQLAMLDSRIKFSLQTYKQIKI